MTTVGCLWRGIKSIEVSILMDGQVPLYTLSGNDLQYAYSADTTHRSAGAQRACHQAERPGFS